MIQNKNKAPLGNADTNVCITAQDFRYESALALPFALSQQQCAREGGRDTKRESIDSLKGEKYQEIFL